MKLPSMKRTTASRRPEVDEDAGGASEEAIVIDGGVFEEVIEDSAVMIVASVVVIEVVTGAVNFRRWISVFNNGSTTLFFISQVLASGAEVNGEEMENFVVEAVEAVDAVTEEACAFFPLPCLTAYVLLARFSSAHRVMYTMVPENILK